MIQHEVRTHKSAENFPIEEHLAYKIAKVAADPVEVPAVSYTHLTLPTTPYV